MNKIEPNREYDAPTTLSAESARLWAALVPSRCRSAGRLAMLRVALEARDRADMASAAIAKQGLTTTTATTGAVHVHPLAKLEREARATFIQAWRAMSLEWDSNIDGRPLPSK